MNSEFKNDYDNKITGNKVFITDMNYLDCSNSVHLIETQESSSMESIQPDHLYPYDDFNYANEIEIKEEKNGTASFLLRSSSDDFQLGDGNMNLLKTRSFEIVQSSDDGNRNVPETRSFEIVQSLDDVNRNVPETRSFEIVQSSDDVNRNLPETRSFEIVQLSDDGYRNVPETRSFEIVQSSDDDYVVPDIDFDGDGVFIKPEHNRDVPDISKYTVNGSVLFKRCNGYDTEEIKQDEKVVTVYLNDEFSPNEICDHGSTSNVSEDTSTLSCQIIDIRDCFVYSEGSPDINKLHLNSENSSVSQCPSSESPFSDSGHVYGNEFVMPLQCQWCRDSFPNNDELHAHINTNCSQVLECRLCSYKNQNSRVMKLHLLMHDYPEAFVCEVCDYRTTKKYSFERHSEKHRETQNFECSLCEYMTKLSSSLTKHMRRHSGETPYSCNFCSYRTVDRSTIVRHMRRHTKSKPHSCPVCNYTSIQKRQLKKHILSKHKPIKSVIKRKSPKYSCSLCDYQCSQKGSLNIHIRRHKGEKPFKCPHCSYSSVEKTHLNRHLWRHANHKPLFCFVCHYRCIQFSCLVKHYQKHNGVKMYCLFCKFVASESNSFAKHLKTHQREWKTKLTKYII